MLTAERKEAILEHLERDGRVVAAHLAEAFGVSEDTIRRDLRELASAGLLQRVHGGALRRSPAAVAFGRRLDEEPEAKAAIAAAAVRLLEPGQVVFIDGGTTTLEVARRLGPELRATVFTTSPHVAIALAEHPAIDVVQLGGRLHRVALTAVGAETVRAIAAIRADLYLFGACSLHPEIGITASTHDEVSVKQAMMEASAEVVALATASKLGTAAPFLVGPISGLTHLVTERSVDSVSLEPYVESGITVVRA